MSKKFICSAMTAMMLMAIPAYAQTTAKCEQKKARTECALRGCEFEGLDLTDAQKNQLRELKDNRCKQMKARNDSAKVARMEAKAKAKADRMAMKEEREAERRAYLKEVKKILGDEKYVMFLENQFVQDSGRPAYANDKIIKGRKFGKPNKEVKLRSDKK